MHHPMVLAPNIVVQRTINKSFSPPERWEKIPLEKIFMQSHLSRLTSQVISHHPIYYLDFLAKSGLEGSLWYGWKRCALRYIASHEGLPLLLMDGRRTALHNWWKEWEEDSIIVVESRKLLVLHVTKLNWIAFEMPSNRIAICCVRGSLSSVWLAASIS